MCYEQKKVTYFSASIFAYMKNQDFPFEHMLYGFICIYIIPLYLGKFTTTRKIKSAAAATNKNAMYIYNTYTRNTVLYIH
jgi:hypothetical protein